MGPDNLLIVAIAVFCLLVIGLALTVYEFHYYILNDEDVRYTKKRKKKEPYSDTN